MLEAPKLYEKYFIQNNWERRGLWELIAKEFSLGKTLYAGSFIQITPSFYTEDVTYVDFDKRMDKFFSDPYVLEYVETQKTYQAPARLRGLKADFTKPLPFENEAFQSLFSFYAGFISQHCKQYLEVGGLVFVDDSFGDATLAFLDSSYEFIAVMNEGDKSWEVQKSNLEEYFQSNNGNTIGKEEILTKSKGPKYKVSASVYCFRKVIN